jgi:hypothetical protein
LRIKSSEMTQLLKVFFPPHFPPSLSS